MEPHDPNDPEFRRQQYRKQMLGVGRPKNASKRGERMVDGLVSAMQNIYRRPGDHSEAILKDRRKALMRYIGRMEHADEEWQLLGEIAAEAARYLGGGELDSARLSKMLHELEDIHDARD